MLRTDLTVLAAGGLLSLGGYRDIEPLAIQGEQAMLASGIFGAVAALAALYERTQTGKGQWLDVSGQECVAFALEDAVADWSINRTSAAPARRGRARSRHRRLSLPGRLRQRGRRTARHRAGLRGAHAMGRRDRIRRVAPSCSSRAGRISSSASLPEGIARFADIFGAFCSTRSKQELYREGQARQIAIAPVNTVADIVADPQLAANGYFQPQLDPTSCRRR